MDFPRFAFTCLALWLALLPSRAATPSAESQIDRARLFSTVLPGAERSSEPAEAALNLTAPEHADDAFGAQVLLKQQERVKPFSGFAEIGAFVTNNVALTRADRHGDSFLYAAVGGSFTQPLGPTLRVDAGVRGAGYRYGRFSALDFQSVDLSVGLTWTPRQLGGAEAMLRYTFTDLTTAKHTREIYRNHGVLVGLQKSINFSRAHGVYFGASAQWSATDPQDTERDEYVGYAGYRVQVTRSVQAEASYRYGRFVYRETHGRQDNNHAVSLGVRYTPRDWMALSATSFASWNRSSRREFDYDAANVGVGAQVSIRF